MKKPQHWLVISILILVSITSGRARENAGLAPRVTAPSPLVSANHSVDWWFAFKLNAAVFPECGGATRVCSFGGKVMTKTAKNKPYTFGQQFVFASSEHPTLQKGSVCAGDTTSDPIGATMDKIYHGKYHFVVWNDQFYQHPKIKGCSGDSCSAPWAHSKGMVAWDDNGNGVVMQVTTPSWPGAASQDTPRKLDGNTLGCVTDDNVIFSQHFFALKLNKQDLIDVLSAMQNASVVTDPSNAQIVNNGGPDDVQSIVGTLGKVSDSTSVKTFTLSGGVKLISKPSHLQVPPWQMVSAELGGVGLRAATWWSKNQIMTTTASTAVKCWDESLSKPGPVEIATSGSWDGQKFNLTGGAAPNNNHAKIGVSTSGDHNFSIFGDMNQEGTLSGVAKSGSKKVNCAISQNPRGGMFFVVDNKELQDSVAQLIAGSTAATRARKPKTTTTRGSNG